MSLNIYITRKVTFEFAPLNWYLIPGKDVSGSWTTYYWFCFFIHVNRLAVNKDWSDDDIIRQIKSLEKEVESSRVKSKTKLVIKRRHE